jgi:hypothetical protein
MKKASQQFIRDMKDDAGWDWQYYQVSKHSKKKIYKETYTSRFYKANFWNSKSELLSTFFVLNFSWMSRFCRLNFVTRELWTSKSLLANRWEKVHTIKTNQHKKCGLVGFIISSDGWFHSRK